MQCVALGLHVCFSALLEHCEDPGAPGGQSIDGIACGLEQADRWRFLADRQTDQCGQHFRAVVQRAMQIVKAFKA